MNSKKKKKRRSVELEHSRKHAFSKNKFLSCYLTEHPFTQVRCLNIQFVPS